ncbi:Dolichyl-phosphate-mannose-protein mannosyltransferase [Sporobacter termitidis DSM 10068]|uniref:Dolichyl-phosphate-mannose-protein mannosyltransferase n=2 Tax=Sporobacter TaxID=44748 RepID=A0A1M5WV95_9FIRM|nr:Dolichyl-phosphate-mannose-protein mannosyltransferase [Sporobacter termitidis DSM 10068]
MFAGFSAYIWLFAGLFIFYLIFSPLVTLSGNSGALAQASAPYDGDPKVMLAMALLLLALLAAAVYLLATRRLTAGRLTALAIAAGFVLRFGYMLYTPFYIRGHDVLSYGGYGHLDYIYRLFRLEGLPDSYGGQFYHPPLAHIADAAVAKIYALLTGATDLDTIFESSKLVPCFASSALLVMSGRLLDALDFSPRARAVALIVIAFHPTFILLSASINNDMLMVFFFMAAFLYTVRWYKNPCYKNIILLALCIGGAMSTKFSGSLIAVFTALIFILGLARHLREGKSWNIFGQFAVFGVICIPLGLWYQIRNLMLFGQPLGFVARISATSALYVGDRTAAERFLTFSVPNMLQNPYCSPFDDFRLWEYTVRCALFGEFAFSPKHDAAAAVMIIASVVLIILSLAAVVWFLFFDRRKNRLAVLGFTAVWALLMVSFVYFNIKYPFGCTMDFRYIVPTVITGAAFLGLLSDKLAGGRGRKALFGAFCAVLAVFCVSSAVFYVI